MVYTWGLLLLTVAGLLADYSKVVVHGLYLGTATAAGLLAGYSKVVVHGLYLGTATVNSSWTAGRILQISGSWFILIIVYLGTATVAGLLARYSKVVINLIFYSLCTFASLSLSLSLQFPPIFFLSLQSYL